MLNDMANLYNIKRFCTFKPQFHIIIRAEGSGMGLPRGWRILLLVPYDLQYG